MTTVVIRADSYHAVIFLDALPQLPINNIRKLFRIMFQAAWENPQSIWTTADWIKNVIREAESEWRATSAEFQNKYRTTDDRGYFIPEAMREKINRPLFPPIKKAKARYERLMKIQSIFNETKEKYYA